MNNFKKQKSNFIFAEIDHTGTNIWTPKNDIETCPLFQLNYTYEKEGKRIRRFCTKFSNN